jgi:hypothetical protein
MDAKWNNVAALDLNAVRRKFKTKKGWWWRTRSSARHVEDQYRRFLFLVISNPGETVVPWSRDLDDFWHEHILNTAKYANDCNAIFGGFIHHDPHLPEGSAPHARASAQTRQMYRAAFGKDVRAGTGRPRHDAGCGGDTSAALRDTMAPPGHHHGGGHQHSDGGHSGHGGHGCGGHAGGHGCGGHGCGGHGCGGH